MNGAQVRVGAVLALVLAGCAGTPATRYHTLLAPPETRAAAPAAATLRWRLVPVTVPAQVDRPQMVLREPDGSLAVLEWERWIASPADELGAALADGLSRRFGPPDAGARAWRVQLDVLRFESVPGRVAQLDAVWTLQGADTSLRCLAHHEQPAGADAAALAEGHRRSVARLVDQIADALAALDAGRPAACGK